MGVEVAGILLKGDSSMVPVVASDSQLDLDPLEVEVAEGESFFLLLLLRPVQVQEVLLLPLHPIRNCIPELWSGLAVQLWH